MKGNILKTIKIGASKNSSIILMGLGIGSFATAVVFAIRATPKALKLIDEKKEEKKRHVKTCDNIDTTSSLPALELTKIEIVKSCWKCYIPTAISMIIGTVSIISSSCISQRRNALLTTACAATQTAFNEFRSKTKNVIGEEKTKEIIDAVAKDKIEKLPANDDEIIYTGQGDDWCLDAQCGRYFKGDIGKIKKAINTINYRLLNEMCVSLNEFYYEIGLEGTRLGDKVGWNLDNGMVEPAFSSIFSDEKNKTCFVVDFDLQPLYNYDMIG